MKAPTVSESISNSPTILPASRIRTTSSERVWIEQARYSSRPRAHPRRSGHALLRPPRRRRPPRLTVSPQLHSTEGRGAARDPGLFNRIHRSAWRNRLINRLGTHERPRSIARKVPKGGFWHRLGLPRGSTVSLFWNHQTVSPRTTVNKVAYKLETPSRSGRCSRLGWLLPWLEPQILEG